MRTINTYGIRSATGRLKESDALLVATLRGVVFGPDPPYSKLRNDLYGAIGLVLLVLAAIIIAAGFGG
jgi:hypothetical protein